MKIVAPKILLGLTGLGLLVAVACLLIENVNGIKLGFGLIALDLLLGAAVALVPYLFIHVFIFSRINKLHNCIQLIHDQGDLTLRAPVHGNDLLGTTAAAFNNLVFSFQNIVGKVVFNSLEVSRTVRQVIAETQQIAQSSNQQRDAAQATKQAMEAMDSTIMLSNNKAKATAQNAHAAHDLSARGAEITTRAASEIERISRSIDESASAIGVLSEQSHAISGIVKVIRDIADQTNLLALNAAIEAARAGEQGRGFAVVADEVRKLAERTSNATNEITSMISAIQEKTETATSSIQKDSVEAKHGAELARQANDALHQISQGATVTVQNAEVIVGVIKEQLDNSETISRNMEDILAMASRNNEFVATTLQEANMLDSLATNLKEIDTVFKLGSTGDKHLATHQNLTQIVQDAGKKIGELLEEAVDKGQIKLDDLFDKNYVPIGNTQPPKFHTSFDTLTDRVLQPFQEALLNRHPEIVYAIACDSNGYVPTHNQRFSKPLTGDVKYDTANNRTKRIFSDPVGKKCGAHEYLYLQQTYRRDTGEIMHDMSSPIYVKGKHWGGFRVGYRTE